MSGQSLIRQTLSISEDAIISTSYADDYAVKGNGFHILRSIAIGTETTIKFVADFSAVDSSCFVFILPLVMTSTDAPIHVSTYGITTYTGGTEYPPINMNATSTIEAAGVIKYGVTSSDTAGDTLRQYEIGSGGNPVTTRGGSAEGSSPIIVPGGAIFILEAENYSTTVETFFNMVLTWYEI